MRYLVIFFILQVVVICITLSITHPTKHQVLGLSYLAQTEQGVDNNNQSPDTIDSNSTDPTLTPVDSPHVSIEPTTITADTTKQEIVKDQNFEDQPIQPDNDTASTTNSDISSVVTLPQPTIEASLPTDLPNSIFSSDTLTDPLINNDTTISDIQSEDLKLKQTKQPEQKVALLFHFVTDNTKTINDQLKNQNFSTIDLLALHIYNQIKDIQTTIDPKDVHATQSVTKQLVTTCSNSSDTLKSATMMMPDELQQDIEITQSACFNF